MRTKSDNKVKQVRAVIDNWAKAVRDCNMDGILANHSPDILMYDVIPPFQSKGHTAYRKAWDIFFQYSTGGQGSFNLTNIKIFADEKIAFVYATLNIFKFKVRLTLGLIKKGDKWLIAHEHHSGLGGQQESHQHLAE